MSKTQTTEEVVEPTADEVAVADEERLDTASEPATTKAAPMADQPRATIDASIEREENGRLWLVFTFAGVAALAAAVVVATFPSLLPLPASNDAVRQIRSVAPILGAVVGALGIYGLYDRHDAIDWESDETVELPAASHETTQGREQLVVGSDIDDLLESIDGRVDPYNGLEASYAADIRRELRESAERVLVDSAGVSAATASQALADGRWTDDQRAASFLGDETVAEPSLSIQLRDWASGESFDRKVEATVDAIRRIERGDLQ